MYLFLDFETRSHADLKKVGGWRYCHHPSTEILCLGYAVDDGPVGLWVPSAPVPKALKVQYEGYYAFNASFDFYIWKNIGEMLGLPRAPIELWFDVMAAAAASAFPQNLDMATKAADIPEKKLSVGKSLIHMLCRPDKTTGLYPDRRKYAARYEAMYEYCKADVLAMRGLLRVLPELSAVTPGTEERELWLQTFGINDRGVTVDTEFISGLVKALDEAVIRKNKEIFTASRGRVSGGTAVAQILAALDDPLPDLTAGTVDAALEDPLRTEHDLTLLSGRRYISKSSTAKYSKMLRYADSAGRVHDLLAYHGATTGRYAGRGIQIQNLPRKGPEDPEPFIRAVLSGMGSEALEREFGDLPVVASGHLRSAVTAARGCVLHVSDFSSVEAVAADWAVGDSAALDSFRQGRDKYKETASGMYGVAYEDVTSTQRQAGKIAVLACVYQGGWRALRDFARGYGIVWTPKEAGAIVRAFRKAKPKLTTAWKDFQQASVECVETGELASVDSVVSCRFSMHGRHLAMTLPSGRRLWFPFVKAETVSFTYEDEDGNKSRVSVKSVTHMWTTAQKQWVRRSIHGGSLFESYIQALCRDLLMGAQLRFDSVVLSVHDELGVELPESLGYTHERLSETMCKLPVWAEGFPLRANGWTGKRYRK